MNQRAVEMIPEYVLGLLPEAERRELETLIARSPELQREVDAAREALSVFAHVAPPVAPRRGARAALLAALSTGERFRPFLDDLMRAFDLGRERVRELLAKIDDPASFEPGPLPGIAVMHFAGGPNAVAPDTGFVRLPRGLQFPYHRHVGHEINYVMEGALRDGDGTLYLPGEAIVMAPGTAHEFSVPDDADVLIAVVQAGFEFIDK